MKARSLTSQLLVGLLGAQVGAIMLAMVIFPLVAPFVSFDEIAEMTLRQRIVSSITRQEGHRPVIRPSQDLVEYVAARPNASFAVFDIAGDAVLEGSAPEIAQHLLTIKPFFPRNSGTLTTDRPGMPGDTLVVSSEDTAFGVLVFATVGNRFRMEDVPSIMTAFLPAILPAYAPVIFGALVLIPLLLRLLLRPLQRLSAEAARLDGTTLHLRLTEAGLGHELESVATALNGALARIESGFEKQRLYAANAAHELRTPIAVLSARIDGLQDSRFKTDLQMDARRIAGLIEQLVTVARLGHQGTPLDENVDLVDLAKGVIADRAPIVIASGRQLELDAARPYVWIEGNRRALQSALGNVLDNAIRAEPERGVVKVRIGCDLSLEVIDHGVGLSPDDKKNVFEPFWRKEENSPGSGLGLAIVKEVVDRHRASVTILDTEGGGATVRFEFASPAV